MDLTTVITGDVFTEKAERQKADRTYTVRIHPAATKVDVTSALRRHFGVEPISVRILKIRPKKRQIGRGRFVTKRQAEKRAIVTLSAKSKALDFTKSKT